MRSDEARGLLSIPRINIRSNKEQSDVVKRPKTKREHSERIMWPGPRKRDGEGVRSSAGARCRKTRDQVKRTRGKRAKRPAGGAERCAADIRARRDRFQDRRGSSPCGLPPLNKPLREGPTVGPDCMHDKSRSATRDVTFELRDCQDLRVGQVAAAASTSAESHGFLRSKRRSSSVWLFRFILRLGKMQGFLSKTAH